MTDNVLVSVHRYRTRKGLRCCNPRWARLTAHYSGPRDELVLVARDLRSGEHVALGLDRNSIIWLANSMSRIVQERHDHHNREAICHDSP